MTFDNVGAFAGHRIDYTWDTGQPSPPWPQLPLAGSPQALPRVAVDYDGTAEDWATRLQALVALPGADRLEGLSVGTWGEPYDTDASSIVAALVTVASRLPSLRVLVFGDMSMEECEVSWIKTTDLSPLWAAYPQLEHLLIRGSDGLALPALRLARLRTLRIECGGLDRTVVHQVLAADLPALEELTLYLGDDDYGATSTVEDLGPLLRGEVLTTVTRLGLVDSVIQDEIAQALTGAPVLERLTDLDLSQGVLTDVGGRALLANPALARLRRLDLHHHYLSDELARQLAALGPDVDVSDPQVPDEYNGTTYYTVAVGE